MRRLLDYYPPIIKEFLEIQVLSEAEQGQIERLWTAHETVLADQFVTTATENGVSRWEKILGIAPKAGTSMKERRFLILSRLSEELPYSMGMLSKQMEALCGKDRYTLLLKNEDYLLVVRVALESRGFYEDVEDLLKRVVPANLVVDLSLLYNQYQMLTGYTHNQLKNKKQGEIKNEVIVDGDKDRMLRT